MAAFNQVFDIAALTNATQTLFRGGTVSRAQIITDMVKVMTDAGWSIVSGPTPGAFGDDYELVSQQSPWYDLDNVPTWYNAGKAVITITNSNSTHIRIQVGVRENIGTILSGAGGGGLGAFFNIGTSGTDMYYHAGPYQFAMWPLARPSSPNTSGVESMPQILVSSLHIPKHLFQREQVKTTVIATNYPHGSITHFLPSNTYIIYQDNLGNVVTKPTLLVTNILTGGHENLRDTGMIWNPSKDPDMSLSGDETTMVGFNVAQPFVSTAVIGSTFDGRNLGYGLFGFLWDAIYVNEVYLKKDLSSSFNTGKADSQTFITYGGKKWVNMTMLDREDSAGNWLGTKPLTIFLKVGDAV